MKQPKKSQLWLGDGSCVRLRPQRANHVWSCDSVHHRMHDGRALHTLNVIEEFTCECLAMRVKRKLNALVVVNTLTNLFIMRGGPSFIRSDNRREFFAQCVRDWIDAVGARCAFIEPGTPGEDGCVESFSARFRDELLSWEIFFTLREAQIIIEDWPTH